MAKNMMRTTKFERPCGRGTATSRRGSTRLGIKGGRMPYRRVLKLQNSVGQFVVHGARNQPSECTWIFVEIYLPDILSKPQNTLLIFQRADHRFGCSIEIRQAGQPFGMVPFGF